MQDIQRAEHIKEAIEYIEIFIKGLDFQAFEENMLVRSATERQLMIVGEACVHITEETKQQFTQIDWRAIKGFRNIVVHEYFGSSVNIIWTVILRELPKLKIVVQEIIDMN